MMKSSMTQASHTGMIINYARFSRNKFGTGYVALKINYNHMKSSMTQSDTQRDGYNACEIPSRFLRHGTSYGL